VSIAKEEWELGHLKAIKEEDERRAEIEEDDMLYTSLLESQQNRSFAGAKSGKPKPKLYSYGGWEFESFDDDAVASFLDDEGSQSIEDDAALVEPLNSRLMSVSGVRKRKKKPDVVKTKLSSRKELDTLNAVPKRKYWTKKRRAELGIEEGSVPKIISRKKLKLSPRAAKLQKLPNKVVHPLQAKAERVPSEPVTLDVKHIGHTVRQRLASPTVVKAPRLKALKHIARLSAVDVVQHRPPLVQPVRSSELSIRSHMVRMPAKVCARTIAEIGAQSPPQPTPILEKLGASIPASPSPMNQTSRLTQIVSSISAASALQNTVLANNSTSSPGTIQYVITTNGRPAVQPVGQTPILVGSSESLPASNLRTNVVYQVPSAGHQTLPQSVTVPRPAQSPRFVLPSSVALPPAASPAPRQQGFVLTAPGGDRQSFVLLPTSNRQSYILAPAAASASQPALVTTTAAATMSTGAVVLRPTNFSVQVSPPRLPRTVQQPIQPALAQRTIHLAPTPPRPPATTNTLPILEKFALQLHSSGSSGGGQPATYEFVTHGGELIAATSPTKAALQQIVYPAASLPSQVVRLPGSTAANSLQLMSHMVVGGGAKTITMPQFVIRQPRQIAPVISATPVPLRNQLPGPRIISTTNLPPVIASPQLSTVIIVDSRPDGSDSLDAAQHS